MVRESVVTGAIGTLACETNTNLDATDVPLWMPVILVLLAQHVFLRHLCPIPSAVYPESTQNYTSLTPRQALRASVRTRGRPLHTK